MTSNFPPFQSHSDTSFEAAASVVGLSKTQRDKILTHLRLGVGMAIGITIDEAAVILDCQTGTASARIRDLERDEMIIKSDERRNTRSGRGAYVYYISGAK